MLTWDDFEIELRRLHDQASNAGVEAVQAAGFSFTRAGDMQSLPQKAHKIFIRGCHYGFARAQAGVGRLVLEIDEEAATVWALLVQARRERNQVSQNLYEVQLAVLRRQKQLIRRVLDEILRQIIGRDTWVLRRLKLYNEDRNIDPDVLRSTLQEAWDRNKEDRMAFHLVTDLLTAVHVGDLIRIRGGTEATRKWSIIELKSGAVNDALQKLINEAPPDTTVEQLEQQASFVRPKANKQVRRMIRQSLRQKRAEEIIDTDKGTHPVFEVPMLQYDAPRDTDDYSDALRELSTALSTKDFAAITVQGCIKLFGIKGSCIAQHGIGIVGHHFYHLAQPNALCLLGREEAEQKKELEAVAKVEFHDLLQVNLSADWSISFFQWPMHTENLFHIALGRHRLFAYIDYDDLFARAKERGLVLEAIPKSLNGVKGIEREHLSHMSFPLPGLSNARGLSVSNAKGQEMIFMSGFVTRLLAEHMLPSFWLDLMENSLQQHGPDTLIAPTF